MKHVSLAISILTVGLSLSAGARAGNLIDAMVTAYQNNPLLNAQRAGLRATDENVSQALAGFRPSLTAQGSIGRDRADSFFAGQTVNLRPKRGTVTLEQPVFRSFQTVNAIKEAESQVRAGRGQLLSVEQGVLLSAVAAYLDVVTDDAVLGLRINNVDVLRRQLQATHDRFEVGEITRTDVAQSEARLSRAISGRISAEADLAASRAAYRRVVGDMPGTLDAPPHLPAMPANEEDAFALALDENPDLTAARYTEEAARRSVKRAKSALGPTVSLVAEYARTKETFVSDVSTENKTVTARATWQLYQGGAASSRIRQAKYIASQRRLEVLQVEREVGELVRNGWESFRAARSIIVSSKAGVRANEIALEGVRQEAEVGSRTTLDVLDAEQELLDAQVTLARADRDAYFAGYRLLASVGRATATYLGLPVEHYDPEDSHSRARNMWYGWATEDD